MLRLYNRRHQEKERTHGMSKEMNTNNEQLARQAIQSLDMLLQNIQGGEGLRVLIDARQALSNLVQRNALLSDKELTTQFPTIGGVSLVRGGQSFTIKDNELELVREAVNTRKREVRKVERRQEKKQS